jgi:hypothetical protein
MSWFKFNFLFLFLLSSTNLVAFEDMVCLDSNFDISVTHKSWPLGLIDKNIKIKKNACEVEVVLKSYFLMKKKWVVDVCREPVHVKLNRQFIVDEVLRKNGICPKKGDAYCESIQALQKVIQDNGLVYAKGEKEQLTTDHGKTYCAYLLIKKYSNEGFVFSRDVNYPNSILQKKKDQIGKLEDEKPIAPGSGKF